MTTPWCIEFNHPNVFRAENGSVKICLVKDNNISVTSVLLLLLASALASTTAIRFTFFGSFVHLRYGIVECKLSNTVSITAPIVVDWTAFLVAEELDSWESLDPVRCTHTLVGIHIHCAYFDYTL